METRLWIGQSRPRHPGDVTGGSQFYYHYMPGFRDRISRELLAHGMVSLHAQCLVDWEKQIYQLGHERGLPMPVFVDASRTTVTTELVGPSVRMLLERDQLPVALVEAEAAALVCNTLRCGAQLADAGLMPFDGHLHNSWVWLENGIRGGHLNFRRILSGDHTYTLARNHHLGRPLWCSAESMHHFPPEAKVFKRADEDAFAQELRSQGFQGETLGDIVRSIARAPGAEQTRIRWRLERAYEQYQQPQELEAALDNGLIEPHRMIQFAVGTHLLALSKEPGLPDSTAKMLDKCSEQIRRMAEIEPAARFSTLVQAAQAIESCWNNPLPQHSIEIWPEITPRWLIWDVRGGMDPEPDAAKVQSTPHTDPVGTFDFVEHSEPVSRAAQTPISPLGWLSQWRQLAGSIGAAVQWATASSVRVAVAIALMVALVAGIRVPQTPQTAAIDRRHAEIIQWVNQAVAANNRASQVAIERLNSVLIDQANPDREFARSVVDKVYAEVEQNSLGRPIVKTSDTTLEVLSARSDKVVRALEVLSLLGNSDAKRWLTVLRG